MKDSAPSWEKLNDVGYFLILCTKQAILFCCNRFCTCSFPWLESAIVFMNVVVDFADMAVQNVIGDSFRGATWVAIHNGGGVGW